MVRSAVRGPLGPLPFSRQEGLEVLKLFAGGHGLIGADARPTAIKEQMGHAAILHFATHSVLDEQDGLRSGLIFAPDVADTARYAVLEAREIACMRLAAKLAVLSACETELGQQSGGEGLMGLAWAFRAAGCPAVVASQWRVDDRATARLMPAFYTRLKAGVAKDVALRAAILQTRAESGHASPYFWAPFELIGDTTPLPLDLIARSSSALQSPGSARK